MDSVTIPVMAKARIGHVAEARCLEALGVDYIDESEVLTPADDKYPHREAAVLRAVRVRRARDLGEALRRIAEGAAMIRSKGEAGSGNIVEAVRHMRAIRAMPSPNYRSHRPKNSSLARGAISGATARTRAAGRARKEIAGRALLRGRRLDAGRRRAHDVARAPKGIFVGSGIFKTAAIY